MRSLIVATCFFAAVTVATAQSIHPLLLDSGSESTYPRVTANDNRVPAGSVGEDGVLQIDLEVVLGDWRIEAPDGPGLVVAAVAEVGKAPSVPAPLIRVETGTHVRVSIHNALEDSTLRVFGLHTHPVAESDSLVISPGGTDTAEFVAGDPGTYLYRMRVGYQTSFGFDDPERHLLVGALVVDPAGGSDPDRIFVMNVWSQPIDSTAADIDYIEGLTINGKSWPYTERQRPNVGDTLRWRVVNATGRNHPMHLHGFYYHVASRGTLLADDVYSTPDRRLVVTETMRGYTTMLMEWVATRPGKWLFHCHLSFHVSPDIRLPGVKDPEGHPPSHMAGLVVGIEIPPGPTDLVERFEPREMTLYANEYPADSLHEYGFSLSPKDSSRSTKAVVPGPLLLMKRYQPTFVTVVNNMSIPTGVHWHGLELDAWSDGVPGWSASDGRVSPVIPPGESFTYKLSLMRPGTFIYHSHLDDVHQLTGGLYGALIVMDDVDAYDPETDHLAVVGWRTPNPSAISDVELNGDSEPPAPQHTTVGAAHRIRIINIAPAGRVYARAAKDSVDVPLRAIAKDGADLPVHQQTNVSRTPRLYVGEAADYLFTPSEPGRYDLFVGYGPRFGWKQEWIVSESDEGN